MFVELERVLREIVGASGVTLIPNLRSVHHQLNPRTMIAPMQDFDAAGDWMEIRTRGVTVKCKVIFIFISPFMGPGVRQSSLMSAYDPLSDVLYLRMT